MSQEKAADVIALNTARTIAGAGDETAGEFLASARQAAGLDLSAISAATKIKIGHLEAIEASDAAALPATPYAVGFVKVYARYLGLDAAALAAQFKTDIGAHAPPAGRPGAAPQAEAAELGGGARLASFFGVVAIAIFILWAAVQIVGSGRETRTAESAGGTSGVVLNEDAAPPPQPKPSARAQDLSAVAVTEGAAALPAEAGESAAPTEEGAPVAAWPTPEASPAEAEAAFAGMADAAAERVRAAPPEAGLPPADVPSDRAEPVQPGGATPPAAQEEQAAPQEDEPEPRIVRREEPPAPVVAEARLARSIAPRYPNACDRNAADIEKVTVIFDITAEGRTANARIVSSTNACFNESALEALRRWRFDPRTVDGAPRPDLGKHATLNFRK